MIKWTAKLLLVGMLAACAGPQANARSVAADVAALDVDFADPAVLRTSDGYYYAYATQSERLTGTINIQIARSRNLAA